MPIWSKGWHLGTSTHSSPSKIALHKTWWQEDFTPFTRLVIRVFNTYFFQSHGKEGEERFGTDGNQLIRIGTAAAAFFVVSFHFDGLQRRGRGLIGLYFFRKDKARMPEAFPEEGTALTAKHDHFRKFLAKAVFASKASVQFFPIFRFFELRFLLENKFNL